jgi:single-strand DNA-binding protein
MMSGINKVILIGRLGANPECKEKKTGGGFVTRFSMATSIGYKDKQTGEKKEVTEWHNIVCFDKLAEIADSYLAKGSNVYIEGSIKTNKYPDKDGGKDRYSTSIIANNLQFLDKKDSVESSGVKSHAGNESTSKLHGIDDDIPF